VKITKVMNYKVYKNKTYTRVWITTKILSLMGYAHIGTNTLTRVMLDEMS
jgi:hypothetical protein